MVGILTDGKPHFPNIALMRASTYIRNSGEPVEWYSPFSTYSRVLYSCIFGKPVEHHISAPLTEGGPGSLNRGPLVSDDVSPDYSLYPAWPHNIGIMTRGCPRGCPWCIVPALEGRSVVQTAEPGTFVMKSRRHTVCLDANILAHDDPLRILQSLHEAIPAGGSVDFNQGLDLRLLTPIVLAELIAMNIRPFRCSWDSMAGSSAIIAGLQGLKLATNWDRNRVLVYILVNYNTSRDDDLYRVKRVIDMGFQPYVMVYDKSKLVWPDSAFYHDLQRWSCRPALFMSTTFEGYQRSMRKTPAAEQMELFK